METAVLTALISAASGLAGVGVGGWVAGRHRKEERQQDRVRAQLNGFYAPMLGLRSWILSTSQLRQRMSVAMDVAWRELVAQRRGNTEALQALSEERFPNFKQVIEENNRQFVEEVMPRYHEMVALFREKMSLAESSTLEHFGALVEFVEIWDRWLNDTLPAEVVSELDHGEEKLLPFYQDLADNFERLKSTLSE